jgi:hypothetical protein
MSHPEPFSELEKGPALARLCVVSFIQFVGVLLTFFLINFGPSIFGVQEELSWQRYCLWIAYVLFGTIGVLFLTLIFSLYYGWRASIAEGVIWFTFWVNIAAFSLATALTGGPSRSFFGQLIPMQLSGMLLLQQQKHQLTHKRSEPWYPAVFTVVVWLIMVGVGRFFGWKGITEDPNFETFETVAAIALFLLGILVTALAYWLPPRPSFIQRFQSSSS